MHQLPLRFFVTSIGSAFLCLGCGGNSGPQLGKVTGTITLDGDPVAGVRVTFVPEDGGSPSYGGTDKDGVYRLQFNQNRAGAELGTHNVLIENTDLQTDDSGKLIESIPVMKIPRKYRQLGALSADVSAGRNELDFDLEPEAVSGTRTASK